MNLVTSGGGHFPTDIVAWSDVLRLLNYMKGCLPFLWKPLTAILPPFEEVVDRLLQPIFAVEGVDFSRSRRGVPAILFGDTHALFHLIMHVVQSGDIKTGIQMLASYLVSPSSAGPASGPFPDDVLTIIFELNICRGSTSLESTQRSSLPPPWPYRTLPMMSTCLRLCSEHHHHQPFCERRKARRSSGGLVAIIVFRLTPANTNVVTHLANTSSELF